MGDYRGYLVQPHRPAPPGRGKALVVGSLTLATCLTLAGAEPTPSGPPDPERVAGISRLAAPPAGPSWAPRPVAGAGLRTVATAGGGRYALHTAGGDVTFLPGINLGSTTPGHQPGELSIGAEQYRSWFAGMRRLGVRVIRIYTIHPPVFYRELAAFNRTDPDHPLYLMQGVYPPDESYVAKGNLYDPAVTKAFQDELRDASAAVAGRLTRPTTPGRAAGTWDTDVTPWLAGWIVGLEFDPYATRASDDRNGEAPGVRGRYFRSTPGASPTERWLAARMDELATAEAAREAGAPIAFVNWPTTDPLAHPDEPLDQEDLVGLDANHVQATAAWPAGTFASYHAYPYYPDFQRHEPALQKVTFAGRSDPYAGYLTALRRHHGDVPVIITEFGVPSSLGSAHQGPLGRSQGGHSERDAMRTDAELLRLIKAQGLAGGFLFAWADEWFKFTWNTVGHQDPERRQLWHDALTNEQHFGLIAMDPAGPPDAVPQRLVTTDGGWPARQVTATVDEAYLHLRIALGATPPSALVVGLDVLPALTGAPAPGTGDRRADAAFTLDLSSRAGRAYLRDELDPMPLDYAVPAAARAPAPTGWKAFQLIVNRRLTIPSTGERLPIELQDAGVLRYGSWDPADPDADSRSLWHRHGDDLIVRVPWAMAGFADPSAHRVAVPRVAVPRNRGRGAAGPTAAELTTQPSPGVTVVLSAAGTDQSTGTVTWPAWQRPYYTERLKQGADDFRDALVEVASR